MSLLQNSNAVTPSAGYNIDYSCRFSNPGPGDGSPGTSRLTKTFDTPTNNKLWTFSIWAKRAYLGTDYSDTGVDVLSSKRFFGAKPTSGATSHSTGWEQDNNLVFRFFDSTDTEYKLSSTARYRDVATWYHCVFQYNSADGTAANRMKMWVNGEQITSLGTANYPPQNTLCGWNEDNFVAIVGGVPGNVATPAYEYGFDGLLAEIHFIDGQGLTAANFGETDEDTGQWKAIKYTGTYGNNGFYFEFKDSAALGTDTSGEGNNWTPGDLAATDQMIDTPQNTNGGTFCTMNSLAQLPLPTAGTFSLQEGNLKCDASGGGQETTGTMMPNSGKWYWELLLQNLASNVEQFGITRTSSVLGSIYLEGVNYRTDGYKYVEGTESAGYGATWTTGDIMAAAVDLDANTIIFYKNNASQGSLSFTTGYDMTPMVRMGANNNVVVLNFGQDSSFAGAKTAQGNKDGNGNGDFYYTPPTGYLGLCTNNLADPSIVLPEEQFNTVLYTGNGVGSRSITGVGFQPNFVWLKQTNNPTAYGHQVFDSIRGGTNYLVPNTTAQENDGNPSYGDQTLLTFESDGFSIGTSDTINEDGYQVASWNWKASGSTASNTEGTITSTVDVNNTAGFSICQYTGNSTADQTFGHGLSSTPEIVVIKNMDQARSWMVWTPGLGSSGGDCTYLMSWDGDGGLGNWCSDTIRLDGATKVKIASGGDPNFDWVNKTGNDFMAYCWTNIEAYSKRGIYKGNGNKNGPFIYTGFRPAYIWLKGQAGSQHWHMFDNKRYPYNQTSNTTTTGIVIDEAANTGGGGGEGMGPIDILSNGFKPRANNGNGNDSSTWYTYLAFAESPFKYANAR